MEKITSFTINHIKITSWGLRFQKGQGRKYDDYHLRPSDDKAEL